MAISTPKQLVRYYKQFGSLKAVARETETSWRSVHDLYERALADGLMEALPRGHKTREHLADVAKGKVQVKPVIHGKRRAKRAKPLELKEGKVTRFLFTCAQNNTHIFEPFWNNLLLLKDYYNAELHVARFAYIKRGLGSIGDKARWMNQENTARENYKNAGTQFWFDERLKPYFSDDRRQVAPGLVWCGDFNCLPTAARPLSGLETVTGRQSGIFPHVKIAAESIPSSERDPVKFNYTTGTVTMRNYIHRKEGFKAEFHHCYGALLVEVDEEGNWWCRQINADSEGTIYDLDVRVKKGEVTCNNSQFAIKQGVTFVDETFFEGIKWGDIHVAQMDEQVREVCWGEGGVLDMLRPKYQFMDDTFDMFARNHHELDDPYTMLQRYTTGQDDVYEELMDVIRFLHDAMRPFVHTVVVNSNHDRALLRWLKNKNCMHDPVNFKFWAAMNARITATVAETGHIPVVLEEAYLEACGNGDATPPKGLQFLAQGDTFIICPKAGGGIDNGQHGDDGPNGSRGTTLAFARMGRKMNKGHDHRFAIIDAVYSTGCCLDLDNPPQYQRGPSSASNTHIGTYVNGKRVGITQWGPDRRPWARRPGE